MKLNIICFLCCLAMLSCKHKHEPPSETLKEAYSIQENALEVDKKIQRILETTDSIDPGILKKRESLLANMVEIEGLDHDHTNCTHDHKPKTIQLTDQEMLKVQSEWRDSMQSLLKEAQSLVENK